MNPTRGPWCFDEAEGLVLGPPGSAGTPTYPDDQRIICEVPALSAETLTPEDLANGRLLAAAPMLRDALAKAYDALVWASGASDFAPDGPARQGWVAVGQPAIAAAQAALAQAEGRDTP